MIDVRPNGKARILKVKGETDMKVLGEVYIVRCGRRRAWCNVRLIEELRKLSYRETKKSDRRNSTGKRKSSRLATRILAEPTMSKR
ncbi:hypothetical protein VN97_g7524 [Penicillium thymicola]|uniref:Uncharacterized protein n=1 Tax=Penicillium thymicola TaxID=293382 RepID=A0AAI9X6Z7_PENTH|nr:hypothetical protein VN97_g7524 [Penicillium thymicola]